VTRFIGRLHTHDWELQVTTAPPLISTIHKSPQQTLSLFQQPMSSPAVPWQRLLTVEILQLPALTSLPSGKYPATELSHSQTSLHSTELYSKSKLLYYWRFTANQFVLASSLLGLTTSNFFFQLNPCCHSPYVTFSLTRRWVCLLWICLAFREVYVSHI
jgi:hypothetical protein